MCMQLSQRTVGARRGFDIPATFIAWEIPVGKSWSLPFSTPADSSSEVFSSDILDHSGTGVV